MHQELVPRADNSKKGNPPELLRDVLIGFPAILSRNNSGASLPL